MGVIWPKLPNGDEVPNSRKDRKIADQEGHPVFVSALWRRRGSGAAWVCGYCLRSTSDPLSGTTRDILAACTRCGKINRVGI